MIINSYFELFSIDISTFFFRSCMISPNISRQNESYYIVSNYTIMGKKYLHYKKI